MNIKMLKEGQIIKNYNELCEILGEEIRECKKRTSHLKEFKKYFNFHRNNREFIIDEIYDVSIIKSKTMDESEYKEYIKNWKHNNITLINDTKFKKIFLETIPRSDKKINWAMSIGKPLFFVYCTVQGYITILEIIDRKNKNCTLKIEYNNKYYNIKSNDLKKCGLSKVLKFKPFIFKYNIGDKIFDNNRDFIITDRKRDYNKNEKAYHNYYKYKCNKCGFDCGEHYKKGEYKKEFWIQESGINHGNGCSCCCSPFQIIVENINSIMATEPWMIPIVGEENSRKYAHSSNEKIYLICPNCEKVKNKKISLNKIYSRSGISCSCSDKIPFGEKFMSNFLHEIDINFISEYSKVDNEWCSKYRYDFYFEIDNEKYIIETHGLQHYKDSTGWNSNTKTLKEEQLNDKIKKELALANGIKHENYIVIDTRYNSLEWIKNSIFNSNLNKLFDLSKTDWNNIMSKSIKSLVIEIVKYINENPSYKKIDLVKRFNTGYTAINSYLNQAKECGLVDGKLL